MALVMIGDGVSGLLKPRWHSLLWDVGPESFQTTMETLAAYPTKARLLYAAEIIVGTWVATRQTPENRGWFNPMLFSRQTRGAGTRLTTMVSNRPRSRSDRFWRKTLPPTFAEEAVAVDAHLREGRFQRSMSLMAGASSILAGPEVSYEHYRGSFGQEVMWTPVVLSGAMTGAGIWGFFSRWAARTVLRWTSAVTLLDSLVGFYFHVDGVARKPGGCRWRTSSWVRRCLRRCSLGSARTWA